MSRIEIFSNTMGEAEWEAVARVFASQWLGTGDQCQRLEAELGAYWRTDKVLLLNSCTSGLYLAPRALGMRPGDQVIMPAVSFVAAGSSIIEQGGQPVFCDVDRHTLNVSAEQIEPHITARTVGVSLLHYGGHPCDLAPIVELCRTRGLWLLEDAACAVASTYHGQAVGTFGQAGAWSFDSMKILVMGDGGALWLRSETDYKRAVRLRNLGLDSNYGSDNVGKRDRWWEFEVPEPSGRCGSNDILAAIGREQLRKVPAFIARRAEVWRTYKQELAGVGDLTLPPEPLEGCTTSYYLFWIQTARRDELAHHLIANDVYCTFRYLPLHLAFKTGNSLPEAEWASEHTLCIPLHQNLTDSDVEKVVDVIRGFYV
jgi:aminotransferase